LIEIGRDTQEMRADGAGKATQEMNRLRSTNFIQSAGHCPHTGDGAASPPMDGDAAVLARRNVKKPIQMLKLELSCGKKVN
jgi:hypothetical protein